ncbi:hypothetical protein BKH46_08580 [Helicobacter sp. 12S02634-8]|uniref:metal-dependent hydrolase n=1 Tax=Helicobacter sp. 12S02634-8 TaxID=1476199 RepID=UPI000BA67703|nr:metal-dependent hydrolase [Helicobacter sp. 12S02634-8]PAF46182.1 hypothetical protein BKH46_08580 [Helicobacter sp. 12S02634-8]
MTFRSHIALGIVGGLALAQTPLIVQSPAYYIQYLPLIALGSILPDIDEPKSFIGRKLPGISHMINFGLGHRGFTHFLLCPLLLAIIGGILLDASRFFVYAVCFGMLMHQLGDMLTKSGIPKYFYPFKASGVLLPKFLRFYTGSIAEWLLLVLILLPTMLLLFYLSYSQSWGLTPSSFSQFYKGIGL